MARLFDPTLGQVYLMSQDIRTYTDKYINKKLGLSYKNLSLFSGTVRENIL